MTNLDNWNDLIDFVQTLQKAEKELRNRRFIKEANAVKDAYKIILLVADEMNKEGENG